MITVFQLQIIKKNKYTVSLGRLLDVKFQNIELQSQLQKIKTITKLQRKKLSFVILLLNVDKI